MRFLLTICAAILANTAGAQALADKYAVLDGRAAEQYRGSQRLQPPRITMPELAMPMAPSGPIPAYDGAYRGPYLTRAYDIARQHSIPENLFARLIQQESGWNPEIVSSKGAIGLAQLMPATAQHLGVNPNDPVQNMTGGARYLRTQYEAFGSWRLALAAYNAGPGAVQRYGGVPPYKETQNYVRRILGE